MKNNTGKNKSITPSLFTFSLPSIAEEMKLEESWEKTGRSARTLSKAGGMRLVLNTMKAGTEIKPHQANGPISVHCIEGHLKFNTPEESLTLRKGEMLTLKEHIRHSVEAIEESAFLLTIASTAPAES